MCLTFDMFQSSLLGNCEVIGFFSCGYGISCHMRMYRCIFMCVICTYICICTYIFPHVPHLNSIHKHLSKIIRQKEKKRKFGIGWFLIQFGVGCSFQFFQRGTWCLVECGVRTAQSLLYPLFFSLTPVLLLGPCSKTLKEARRGGTPH